MYLHAFAEISIMPVGAVSFIVYLVISERRSVNTFQAVQGSYLVQMDTYSFCPQSYVWEFFYTLLFLTVALSPLNK